MTSSKKGSDIKVDQLDLVYRNPADLIEYEENSRKHSAEQLKQLDQLIERFGFNNPIIIDGSNGIIAGHARKLVALRREMPQVPCIVKDNLSEDEKRAYVIADNKIALNGQWSEKVLLQELTRLQSSGIDMSLTAFDEKELRKMMGKDELLDGPAAEVPFSEELEESHNFVVLYFDNETDWISAQTHFGIKTVASKRMNGKPWSKGIGRVVNGGEYLTRIKTEAKK